MTEHTYIILMAPAPAGLWPQPAAVHPPTSLTTSRCRERALVLTWPITKQWAEHSMSRAPQLSAVEPRLTVAPPSMVEQRLTVEPQSLEAPPLPVVELPSRAA